MWFSVIPGYYPQLLAELMVTMPKYAGYFFQFLLCIAMLCCHNHFFAFPHELLQSKEKGSSIEVGKLKGSKEPCGLSAFFFFSLQVRKFLSMSMPKCNLAPLPPRSVQGDFSLRGWPPQFVGSSPVALFFGCASPGRQVSGVFLPCSCSREPQELPWHCG